MWNMRREIAAVVFFLKRLVKKGEKLESHKIELFVERLAVALQEKFRGHWYPENPSKGQAYRCCFLSSDIFTATPISERFGCCVKHETECKHLLLLFWHLIEIISYQLNWFFFFYSEFSASNTFQNNSGQGQLQQKTRNVVECSNTCLEDSTGKEVNW